MTIEELEHKLSEEIEKLEARINELEEQLKNIQVNVDEGLASLKTLKADF